MARPVTQKPVLDATVRLVARPRTIGRRWYSFCCLHWWVDYATLVWELRWYISGRLARMSMGC